MRTYFLPDGPPSPDGLPSPEQKSYAQILAIHAALLPTGKILFFGGDQHDPGRNHLGMWGEARLFDCATLTVSKVAPDPPMVGDLFCCGHAFLPDGRLLVAGGVDEFERQIDDFTETSPHHMAHARGHRHTNIFDGTTNTWHPTGDMVPQPGTTGGGGRWYPTLCTLGSGRVVALSGHPLESDDRHLNTTVETFALSPTGLYGVPPSGGSWSDEGELPSLPEHKGHFAFYPRVHVLPDGRLFLASPIKDRNWAWNSAALSWATPSWENVAKWTGENDLRADLASSVLLPLLPAEGYRPRVLVTGSSQPIVIDLSVSKPKWTNTKPRSGTFNAHPPTAADTSPPKRLNGNLVLLPTGEVVACGGERTYGKDTSAVFELEMYRPATNTWVTLPEEANTHVPRGYHSVALLMPDGRVWMAGSNKNCDYSFHRAQDYPADPPPPAKAVPLPTDAQQYLDAEHKVPVDNRELEIEVFEPWYFDRTDRPTFKLSKAAVSVGARFALTSDQAAHISQVVALRAGSCTHAFNPDQRLVGLTYTRSHDTLTVTVPDNQNLLPPGPYLVFVLANVVDKHTGTLLEVPSVGHFIQIHNFKPKEIKPELDFLKPASPEGIMTKPAGEGITDFRFRGELIFVLRLLAERVDDIERRMAGSGHHFIPSEARPETSTVMTPPAPVPRPMMGDPAPEEGSQALASAPEPALDEVGTHGHMGKEPLPPAHEPPSDASA